MAFNFNSPLFQQLMQKAQSMPQPSQGGDPTQMMQGMGSSMSGGLGRLGGFFSRMFGGGRGQQAGSAQGQPGMNPGMPPWMSGQGSGTMGDFMPGRRVGQMADSAQGGMMYPGGSQSFDESGGYKGGIPIFGAGNAPFQSKFSPQGGSPIGSMGNSSFPRLQNHPWQMGGNTGITGGMFPQGASGGTGSQMGSWGPAGKQAPKQQGGSTPGGNTTESGQFQDTLSNAGSQFSNMFRK